MIKFDRETLGRFWRITRLFFTSEEKLRACGMLLLIACLSLSLSGLNVMRNYVDRDFMNALAQRDQARFFKEMSMYFLLFGVMVPLAVFYRYAEERLGLFWRNWLSCRMIDGYFAKHAYYRIGIERQIDNPDQRMEEDIRTFTVNTLSFTLIFFNSCVALAAFVSILWSISGMLMAGAIVYAFVGSLVTYFVGRRLIGLNFLQLRKEADYRYKLVNVRDFSEPIAFYRSEAKEGVRVKDRLGEALRAMRSIIDWNRNLGFFTNGYNYVLAILPIIIVAPLYLQGKIEFGVVIQAAGAFGQVLGALSIIVVHFGGLSNLAAVANRLGTFWETVERAHAASEQSAGRVAVRDAATVSFDHVTLLTPDRSQVMVKDLNLTLAPEDRLLVSGPSGSGKSSLLRLLGGLWREGSGSAGRPPLARCMFLPQRPYMLLGNLRGQFVYGTAREDVGDAELEELVEIAGLTPTVERVGGLDKEEDWKSLLSLGEQQLVGFVRMLVAQPKMLFMDEAANAVDERRRELLYAELKKRGIAYMSIGARSDLARFHTKLLDLQGRGGWRLSSLPGNLPAGGGAA